MGLLLAPPGTTVVSAQWALSWNSRAGSFPFQFGIQQTKLIPLSFMESLCRNTLD